MISRRKETSKTRLVVEARPTAGGLQVFTRMADTAASPFPKNFFLEKLFGGPVNYTITQALVETIKTRLAMDFG